MKEMKLTAVGITMGTCITGCMISYDVLFHILLSTYVFRNTSGCLRVYFFGFVRSFPATRIIIHEV